MSTAIEIACGDCREVLADAEWDVMITDPPYREHVHKSAVSCGTPGAAPSNAPRGVRKRDLGFEHLDDELRLSTCAMAARTPKWSCIFTDVESVGAWRRGLTEAGATYIRAIPWVRWSMPQLSGDRPPQGHEMVVVAWGSQKGPKSWNGPGNLTHFAQTCMRGKGKHKAQKPLDLILELVEFFSDRGDWVCDPFTGSGTTALAARVLGRNFIGSELSQEWADRARARATAVNPIGAYWDDGDRFSRYTAVEAIRKSDMARMASNTARIAENRRNAATLDGSLDESGE